jgi:hypothetical protein
LVFAPFLSSPNLGESSISESGQSNGQVNIGVDALANGRWSMRSQLEDACSVSVLSSNDNLGGLPLLPQPRPILVTAELLLNQVPPAINDLLRELVWRATETVCSFFLEPLLAAFGLSTQHLEFLVRQHITDVLRVADRHACQRGVVVVQRFDGVGIIVPMLQEVKRHKTTLFDLFHLSCIPGFYHPLRYASIRFETLRYCFDFERKCFDKETTWKEHRTMK